MLRAISEYAARAANRRVAQVLLSYADLCNSKTSLPTRVQRTGEVFANNYLHLGHVNVVGFDLDYTLVNYTKKLQGEPPARLATRLWRLQVRLKSVFVALLWQRCCMTSRSRGWSRSTAIRRS